MTFEEVFGFAYKPYIAVLRNLADELDRADFIELLQRASAAAAAADTQKWAESLSRRDFEAWTDSLRTPDRFWKHVGIHDVVEDTDAAYEVKFTECLWAKTFREADAAEIGYALFCHPDFASCQAFNPKVRMIRTKTLMQGDDCCNHRWVWEA